MSENDVRQALGVVLNKIEQACQRRRPELQNVTPLLVAASKFKSVDYILEAYKEGQRHFGENYVQELIEKANNPVILEKCKDIKWHFIGHLQSNKVNKILCVPNLHMIETVHSQKLAAQINESWPKFGSPDTKLKIFIQVNTSGEAEKSGIEPKEVCNLAKYILDDCPNLQLHGLMTIGKYGYDPKDGPNPDFITLLKCRDNLCKTLSLDWKNINLSMGMSSDYEQAIEMGSTNVRVGTSIFGERPQIN
ncbi:pyridoxal phosphate homeostasis protein-like [Aethina tumida]|uniref:pyridoxal phosphate homeostasis protein-like n=1 Tax=Aethina tumida TaxID=116153 RepID=UPI002147A868|nr:pyridoxal phosphate homeostasis protein-like [Aethina tumida]